jgi:hypothetical protein
MTTLYGLDMYSLEEIDETRTVEGLELVAEDTYWRLQTPTGQGILAADAPTYGFDLLEAIGSAEVEGTFETLPDRVNTALADDERILTSTVTIDRTVDGPVTEYDIAIHCETAEGPFDLVGTAGDGVLDLAVKLLPGGI